MHANLLMVAIAMHDGHKILTFLINPQNFITAVASCNFTNKQQGQIKHDEIYIEHYM